MLPAKAWASGAYTDAKTLQNDSTSETLPEGSIPALILSIYIQ